MGLIDPAVALDDGQSCFGIVIDEGRDRVADRLLDHAPHPEDVVLDLAQLAIERLTRRMRSAAGRRCRPGRLRQDLVDLALELLGGQLVSFGHRPFPGLNRTDRRHSLR